MSVKRKTRKKHEIPQRNPWADEITKISRAKKFRSLEFKSLPGKIGFHVYVDWNPNRAKDWRLHILSVPDLQSPEHEHYLLSEKEMLEVRKFIDQILFEIRRRKRKSNRKGTTKESN